MRIIKRLNNVRIELNENGNFVVAYGKYHGSKNVAKNIEYEDLADALVLVKEYYKNSDNPEEPQYLDNALNDFYGVVKELVDIVFSEKEDAEETWKWLKGQKRLISEAKALFKRAGEEQASSFVFGEFERIFS